MSNYTITGTFEPKEKLFENNKIKEDVYWDYDGEIIEIHNRDALKTLQDKLFKKRDWKGVKIINKIFLELDLYERKTMLSSHPINIQIEHTNFCNAKCIMCSHCFTKNHGGYNMSDDDLGEIKKILPYVERVTLHGMGEPFMHPRIIDILKMYHSYEIKVTCNTNGSIMSDELAEMIHKCFYDIAISCDACTKTTYEAIRKGLNFEKFIRNVKLLRAKGPELFMRMAVVAMRQNLEELPGIIEMAAELGFQEVLIVDVTTQGLLENQSDSINLYPATAKYYLNKAINKGLTLGIPVKIPDYIMNIETKYTMEEELKIMNSIPLYKEDDFTESLYERYEQAGFIEPVIKATTDNFVIPSQYKCNGVCDFVVERPFINAKGDVFLCCTNWMHTVGNIYKDGGFEAIWNGKTVSEIRQLFYNGYVPKYCVGCIFLRNDMMCKRIEVEDITKDFYKHNYDEMVAKLIENVESDK